MKTIVLTYNTQICEHYYPDETVHGVVSDVQHVHIVCCTHP